MTRRRPPPPNRARDGSAPAAPGPTRLADPAWVPALGPHMSGSPEAFAETPRPLRPSPLPPRTTTPPGRPSLTRNPRAARSARAGSLRACALPPPSPALRHPAKRGSGSQLEKGGAGSRKTRHGVLRRKGKWFLSPPPLQDQAHLNGLLEKQPL